MKAFFAPILKLFFYALYQPLYNLLMLIAFVLPQHSIGWAIIILTIIIRLILLPQSIKAAHSQVKNLELQPKINKIKAQIKDQAEQSKALMALYKEEGISPFGACLPLLIQFPVLIVMYQVFRSGLTTSGFGDLYDFVPRLSTINVDFFGMNLTQNGSWILAIFAGALQLGLSFMMMPAKKAEIKQEEKSADPMAAMNKQMLYFPAIITVFFGHSMPSALVIYWIITTLFSIGQQYYINKAIAKQKSQPAIKIISEPTLEDKIEPVSPEIIEEPKKKNWMAKMTDSRLSKQAKKAGVSVTVRTKKK